MAGSSPLDPAHLAFLREHLPPEPPALADLRRRARDAGIPDIAITWEQGCFLQVLLRAAGARRVVEVGTLGGYSAIAMAMALPDDGRVDTIELDPERAAFAEAAVAEGPAAGRVVVHRGAGKEVLPRFADSSTDAALLDADKENYPAYLEECLRIVRPGGLVFADNAFAFGRLFDGAPNDPSVAAIRRFDDLVPTVTGLQALIVPLGDGLWVGVRR